MTKSQEYFQDMLEIHKILFSEFEAIHKKYVEDPDKYQDQFNEKGMEILTIIRKYENMLCSQSEGGKYSKFSSNLSETFWKIIRGKFPKIDFIGIK